MNAPTKPHPSLYESFPSIATDLVQVDRVIRERLTSDVALINTISDYIIAAGGKRLRPVLLMLFARALGYGAEAARPGLPQDRHWLLAAVVEFIHTATLLHDDVVDESTLRRGRNTANAEFGNAAPVLVGDFLYSRAFQMMVEADNLLILKILADTTNTIAEGEVLQLLNCHDPDVDEAAYLQVIRYKTARLFEAAARIGAVLAGGDEGTQEAAAAYGRHLGTAFQLIDDVLDYGGDTHELGKNIGDDLREGKPTLPLLLAMQRGTEVERLLIRHAIEHGEAERLPEIVDIVRRTGALEATRQAARTEADKACATLQQLPATRAREALLELCVRSVERSF